MFQHFANREEAGRALAEKLKDYAGDDTVVLALPRGGVPIGYEIARALDAPLDIVLVRKLGAPGQPELAIGAVVDGETPYTHLNDDIVRYLNVDDGYIEKEKTRQLEEIGRRRKTFFGDRARPDPRDKTVILVDDGIATGATARAALRGVREAGAKRIVLAVPVAAQQSIAEMQPDADDVVALLVPGDLGAIGFYYRDFSQLDDRDVLRILEQRRKERGE